MPVTVLGSGLAIARTDADVIAQAAQVARSYLVSKAQSDLGVIGEAMADRQVDTSLGSAARAWQQKLLADAAIHSWLYKKNAWVRTCVDLIAQRATADDYAIESASGNDDDQRTEAMAAILNKINPKQSLKRILRGVYRDLQINGNWYGRVQFANGVPVAVYRIDFRTIAPVPVAFGFPTLYSIFANGRSDLAPQHVDAQEILHLTLNDGGENGCGLSPLESLDYTLAIDQAAITFNQGFLQNGAKAGDIYSMDPTMGPEQVERERENMLENFTKPSQAYMPMFVQGITLVRDGTTIHKDMDFVELRKWDREEVLAVYSVPGSLVTMEVGALGSNGKEQDSILFNEAVVAPLQKQTFEDLNRELLENRFGITDLVLVAPKIAGVKADLVDAAGKMQGATGNEIRRLQRLDDMEDGFDQPIWHFGQIVVIGEPGHPDSILLTPRGAFLGDPLDPAELAANAAGSADDGASQSDGAGTSSKQVRKADLPEGTHRHTPRWLRAHVAEAEKRVDRWLTDTTDELAREVAVRARHTSTEGE